MNRKDKLEVLLGGAISMVGIEAAARAAALVTRKQQPTAGDTDDDDDENIPYVVGDGDISALLCFNHVLLYISAPSMQIFEMQPQDSVYEMSQHYASMYREALRMKNRRQRCGDRLDMFLLHMLLADLSTLHSTNGSLEEALVRPFVSVICNMTQNSVLLRKNAWFQTSPTVFATPRMPVGGLLEQLHVTGAVTALAARILQTNNDAFFLAREETRIPSLAFVRERCGCRIVATGAGGTGPFGPCIGRLGYKVQRYL
jgi:hypothetical protein